VAANAVRKKYGNILSCEQHFKTMVADCELVAKNSEVIHEGFSHLNASLLEQFQSKVGVLGQAEEVVKAPSSSKLVDPKALPTFELFA